MAFIIALVVLLQIAAPLALLFWLARGGSRASVASKGLITALYLLCIALAGLWMFIPWWTLWIYAAGAGIAAALGLRRGATPLSRLDWSVRALAATLLSLLAIYAASGRRAPDGAVDLHPPLLDGRHYVVSGGSNALLNLHLETLDVPAYRGQSYAVDLVALNRWGMRSHRLFPQALNDYVIFGAPIYSPCAGVVLQAENALPDLNPPEVDREHMPGNHVILGCDGVVILLAHMQHGTVRVRHGDAVATGQLLGNVGNSGNTAEPHLHIHAQTPSRSDSIFAGEPLAMRFHGRYLARSDEL